jgi:hypothetical protein
MEWLSADSQPVKSIRAHIGSAMAAATESNVVFFISNLGLVDAGIVSYCIGGLQAVSTAGLQMQGMGVRIRAKVEILNGFEKEDNREKGGCCQGNAVSRQIRAWHEDLGRFQKTLACRRLGTWP